MRHEIGEPTGMRVRNEAGTEVMLEFTAFVAGIERGDIRPEDEVCSHIVTQDCWVRIGEMRLYREIMQNVKRAMEAQAGVWPPAPQQE